MTYFKNFHGFMLQTFRVIKCRVKLWVKLWPTYKHTCFGCPAYCNAEDRTWRNTKGTSSQTTIVIVYHCSEWQRTEEQHLSNQNSRANYALLDSQPQMAMTAVGFKLTIGLGEITKISYEDSWLLWYMMHIIKSYDLARKLYAKQ